MVVRALAAGERRPATLAPESGPFPFSGKAAEARATTGRASKRKVFIARCAQGPRSQDHNLILDR